MVCRCLGVMDSPEYQGMMVMMGSSDCRDSVVRWVERAGSEGLAACLACLALVGWAAHPAAAEQMDGAHLAGPGVPGVHGVWVIRTRATRVRMVTSVWEGHRVSRALMEETAPRAALGMPAPQADKEQRVATALLVFVPVVLERRAESVYPVVRAGMDEQAPPAQREAEG